MWRIFISSTIEDLKEYRTAVEDAITRSGCIPVRSEYFPASGTPVLDECRSRVSACDVVVVIVAHHYGWIPEDTQNKDQKSITWMECDEALKADKEVLAFLV